MNTQIEIKKIYPPGLFKSIASGFNAVANHIGIILFPIALDFLLWFGPRLKITELFRPLMNDISDKFTLISPAEMKEMVNSSMVVWQSVIEEYNMFTTLRTYPIGIPSLMAQQISLENPLGYPLSYEFYTIGFALLSWFVLVVLGLSAGGIFFYSIALTSNGTEIFSLKCMAKTIINTFLLTIILIFLLLILTIPIGIIVSILALFSPSLAQIAIFVLTIFALWLLLPLAFSPHGIYAFNQNALISMVTSFRLVRFFLPGTGFFILITLLISQGMDMIWNVPPSNSWMSLIGIVGHGFISTSLIAASFIYYRGGIEWMKENMNYLAKNEIKV